MHFPSKIKTTADGARLQNGRRRGWDEKRQKAGGRMSVNSLTYDLEEMAVVKEKHTEQVVSLHHDENDELGKL